MRLIILVLIIFSLTHCQRKKKPAKEEMRRAFENLSDDEKEEYQQKVEADKKKFDSRSSIREGYIKNFEELSKIVEMAQRAGPHYDFHGNIKKSEEFVAKFMKWEDEIARGGYFEQMQFTSMAPMAYEQLGILYEFGGSKFVKKARTQYKKALRLADRVEYGDYMPHLGKLKFSLLERLAGVYFKGKIYESALKYAKKGYEKYKMLEKDKNLDYEEGDVPKFGFIFSKLMAKYNHALGSKKSAKKYFKEATVLEQKLELGEAEIRLFQLEALSFLTDLGGKEDSCKKRIERLRSEELTPDDKVHPAMRMNYHFIIAKSLASFGENEDAEIEFRKALEFVKYVHFEYLLADLHFEFTKFLFEVNLFGNRDNEFEEFSLKCETYCDEDQKKELLKMKGIEPREENEL